MTLGDRIRRSRREKGLTLSQLSKRSGYNKSYLCQIENSYHINPSAKLIDDISLILGVTIEYLLRGEKNDIELAILLKLKKLSESDKNRVIKIIDDFQHE